MKSPDSDTGLQQQLLSQGSSRSQRDHFQRLALLLPEMVYCGLPSKACSHCRSRRIKCDLSLPSCGQCVRSHRTCFGYRNTADVRFRDQSEDVVCKAQRSRLQRASENPTKELPTNFCSLHATLYLDICKHSNATCPTPWSVPVSIELEAFYFFLRNYSSQSSKNFGSVYEHIPILCCSEPPDNPLLDVVTALGLAGLSHHTKTSGMEVTASAWYDKALHKINYRLRDPELATTDQTLLVVLLLGLYETNTCNTPRSMKSWLNHIKGATALLELRGEEQLDSDLRRVLFVLTRTHIISGCYQTRSPIPDVVVQLSQKFRAQTCHNKSVLALEDLVPIIFNFCNIRPALPFHPLITQSESTTRTAISYFLSIAQALTEWNDGLSAVFFPLITSASRASSEVLSKHFDIYDDIWTAGVMNNYRTNSILVHEALINQLIFLRDHYCPDLHDLLELEDRISHSRSILLSLIDAVCASVPSLLQSNSAVAGVGLLWTLYVSAQISPQTAPLPVSTRSWIIGRLEKIGAEMSVRQATMLAEILHQHVNVTDLLTDESETSLTH